MCVVVRLWPVFCDDSVNGAGLMLGGMGEGKIQSRKALDKFFMVTSRLWRKKEKQAKETKKSVPNCFCSLTILKVCDEVLSIWTAGGNQGIWHMFLFIRLQ